MINFHYNIFSRFQKKNAKQQISEFTENKCSLGNVVGDFMNTKLIDAAELSDQRCFI